MQYACKDEEVSYWKVELDEVVEKLRYDIVVIKIKCLFYQLR
jgi:hypothetical protein